MATPNVRRIRQHQFLDIEGIFETRTLAQRRAPLEILACPAFVGKCPVQGVPYAIAIRLKTLNPKREHALPGQPSGLIRVST